MSPIVLAASLSLSLSLLAQPADRDGADFFEKKIRPVLVDRCYRCHSADAKKVRGGLLLDSRAGVRKGGDSGPAIVPGDAGKSLLIQAIRYEDEDLAMPPKGKLPDAVIADFEKWVALGATDPRSGEAASEPRQEGIDYEAARQHWAFRAPERHEPPAVENTEWPRQPIDAFILAGLENAGLEPNPQADRRILIRRVTLDLTGLPPASEEVEAFVADRSPHAYERLVERLLASPHYGERWTRMWLDVARYAEDQAHIVGNNQSLFFPNAWFYRDWVIRALNEDIPYDRFLRLQLAADLLEPDERENQAALGFIGLGPKYYRRNDLSVMADEWEDRVDTVTRGLLALTVACARCHDHKYDPISTEDYYALAGVFASTEMFNRPLDDKAKKGKNGHAKSPGEAMHIVRDAKPTDLNVFVRGDVNSKGPLVPRRFVRVLCREEPVPFGEGSGRSDLARAIAGRDNPLTARVLVNRVWALNFGAPLVGTPSNFGRLGEKPSHPDLLDDLAVRFMESGWSLKWLQREIVLSAAYRQTSDVDERKRAVDPVNRLLWRMNRRRLDVEVWRDALLWSAGRLDRSVGGKSIDVQDPEVRRRTLYGAVSRFQLNPMLALFDFPDPNVHSARRTMTTTPLQKLFVLNSRFMVRLAESLAERLRARGDGEGDAASVEERIRGAYSLLYGRLPTEDEVRLGVGFLGRGSSEKIDLWTQYAQVLLASNELLFVD